MKRTFLVIIVSIFSLSTTFAGQEFEAATVKPNQSGQRGSSLPPPIGGRFTATNVSLKDLILYAYHVQDFQLSGGPSWMDSQKYDVVAKADGSAPEDQVRIMLQKLLVERFRLKVSRQNKEAPIYALVIAKNGLKMAKSSGDCKAPGTITAPCGGFRVRNRSIVTGQNVPLSELVDLLSILTGRVVVDKTALTGKFDIDLKWSPDATLAMTAESADSESPNGATLFTALQEQLGLRLESQRGPIAIVVVEDAQKPAIG